MSLKALARFNHAHKAWWRRGLITAAAISSLSSCSWITCFAVANATHGPISDLDAISQAPTSTAFDCDAARGVVTLTLPPGQAVAVFRSVSYSGHSRHEEDVSRLRLSTPHGSVEYSGDQLTPHFKKHSLTLYVLTYQPQQPLSQ